MLGVDNFSLALGDLLISRLQISIPLVYVRYCISETSCLWLISVSNVLFSFPLCLVGKFLRAKCTIFVESMPILLLILV